MQEWTGASPPAASALVVKGAKDAVADLRRVIDRYWPLLARADQRSIADWLIESVADPGKSVVRRGPGKQARPATSDVAASRDDVQPRAVVRGLRRRVGPGRPPSWRWASKQPQ